MSLVDVWAPPSQKVGSMQLCRRSLAAVVFVGITSLGAAKASAAPITIDAVGDAFSVDWSGVSSPNNLPVSIESDWSVTNYTPTSVTFAVSVSNTSASSPASLTGLGFNTDVSVLSGTETSAIWEHVSVSDKDFDVCVENDANNNCFGNSGNPSDGLAVDLTHAFTLTLTFGSTLGGVTLSDFFARVQGIAPNDSAKLTAEPSCTSGCDEQLLPVPEPATLSLVGFGLAGAAVRRFRRRP